MEYGDWAPVEGRRGGGHDRMRLGGGGRRGPDRRGGQRGSGCIGSLLGKGHEPLNLVQTALNLHLLRRHGGGGEDRGGQEGARLHPEGHHGHIVCRRGRRLLPPAAPLLPLAACILGLLPPAALPLRLSSCRGRCRCRGRPFCWRWRRRWGLAIAHFSRSGGAQGYTLPRNGEPDATVLILTLFGPL